MANTEGSSKWAEAIPTSIMQQPSLGNGGQTGTYEWTQTKKVRSTRLHALLRLRLAKSMPWQSMFFAKRICERGFKAAPKPAPTPLCLVKPPLDHCAALFSVLLLYALPHRSLADVSHFCAVFMRCVQEVEVKILLPDTGVLAKQLNVNIRCCLACSDVPRHAACFVVGNDARGSRTFPWWHWLLVLCGLLGCSATSLRVEMIASSTLLLDGELNDTVDKEDSFWELQTLGKERSVAASCALWIGQS